MTDVAKHDLIPLVINPPTGSSSQPKAVDEEELATPNEAIHPPLPLEQLTALNGTAAHRRPIIEAIALNTVGQGYAIEWRRGREGQGDEPEEQLAEYADRLEALWKRDLRLHNPTAVVGFSRVKIDEESCGNGGIEVSRSRLTGEIDGLYHVPGDRLRRLKDHSGWVLLPLNGWAGGSIRGNQQVTRFYNFGDKVQYDDQGRPQAKVQKGKLWDRNEVIIFQLPTTSSRDYGLPRDEALTIDYLGDKLASESNVSFFNSSGTPPTIVFVQGEESQSGGRTVFKVPRETAERIANTLKSDAGHLNRVAIIPVPPGTKTEAVKLGEVSDRDVGFNDYRSNNRGRMLGAFRMQPIFIGVQEGDALDPELQRAITLEQLFDPEQTRWEGIVNTTVLWEMSGGDAVLKFKRLAVEDGAIRRESSDKLAEAGGITRREHREAHGYPPLPEAEKSSTEIEWNGKTYKSAEPEPGQVPYGWNDEIVNLGQPAGAQNRAIVDRRGGGENNQGDDFTSPRPDELPTATQTAAAKGHGSPVVEPHVLDLVDSLSDISDEQLAASLRRSAGIATALAAQASANGADGGE